MSDHEDAVAETSNSKVQAKKDRPARKQVKAGQVTKNEVVQSGKEYSK